MLKKRRYYFSKDGRTLDKAIMAISDYDAFFQYAYYMKLGAYKFKYEMKPIFLEIKNIPYGKYNLEDARLEPDTQSYYLINAYKLVLKKEYEKKHTKNTRKKRHSPVRLGN